MIAAIKEASGSRLERRLGMISLNGISPVILHTKIPRGSFCCIFGILSPASTAAFCIDNILEEAGILRVRLQLSFLIPVLPIAQLSMVRARHQCLNTVWQRAMIQ